MYTGTMESQSPGAKSEGVKFLISSNVIAFLNNTHTPFPQIGKGGDGKYKNGEAKRDWKDDSLGSACSHVFGVSV